jgi:hypothetical protein
MNSTKTATTYAATLHVWSRLGHTPLTKRNGPYYDVLHLSEITVKDRADALAQGEAMKAKTPHGDSGHVQIHEYPNQNHCSLWF